MRTWHTAILLWVALSTAAAQSVAIGERTAVDLTIYNQNLSLIREERQFAFPRGISRAIVPDIPSTIDGTSLHFRSLTDPQGVRVIEQNYQFDLISQSKVLEKYVGKEIEFVRFNEVTKTEYSVFGKLLAAGFGSGGGMLAEIDGKIELNPTGRVVLPALPEGLILRPQLAWLISNSREGKHRTELSYLAGQLSWSCDYVAVLDKSDTKLDLTGWVTLVNSTGTSFKNAGLKLVAGDVNIVRQRFQDALPMAKNMASTEESQPQFTQSELFEYKLYSLQRRTDLNNNETKQIELTSGRNVDSRKVFIYDGLADQWRYWHNNYAYRGQGSFGQQSNRKVGVYMTFRNDEKSGLGIALPRGRVRVYKRDDEGKEQFIGEDQIDHTPKDEEMRLYLGNAFDVVGERVQKDFKSTAGGRVVDETIEIKIRNHKKESIVVDVYEHPWRWSQWEIVKATSDWLKADQSTIKFPVKVQPDSEAVVQYTIRYSW